MDLFSPAMRRDPYPLYDQLRATSPVLHLPGPDLWVVFGHDAVKRALSDHEAFSSNVGPSRGNRFEWLLFMDPPRHTQLRAIIGRAFGARSIAGLAPRIRALASELLDRVGDPDCDRGELDLVAGRLVGWCASRRTPASSRPSAPGPTCCRTRSRRSCATRRRSRRCSAPRGARSSSTAPGSPPARS
ncbi:MAG TPA: hypothetical protein VHT91_31275 [Kofleriaceae bacterium]|jgi:hypothetical protein|nr:hypothetical protein [Kofleriaceae bacterium]